MTERFVYKASRGKLKEDSRIGFFSMTNEIIELFWVPQLNWIAKMDLFSCNFLWGKRSDSWKHVDIPEKHKPGDQMWSCTRGGRTADVRWVLIPATTTVDCFMSPQTVESRLLAKL